MLSKSKYKYLCYNGEVFEFITNLKFPNEESLILYLDKRTYMYSIETVDDFYYSVVENIFLAEEQTFVNSIIKNEEGLKMVNPIDSLMREAKETGTMEEILKPVKSVSSDVENIHYDLMNKLFSTLNIIKGFDVSMNGPSEGKILLKFKDLEFELKVNSN